MKTTKQSSAFTNRNSVVNRDFLRFYILYRIYQYHHSYPDISSTLKIIKEIRVDEIELDAAITYLLNSGLLVGSSRPNRADHKINDISNRGIELVENILKQIRIDGFRSEYMDIPEFQSNSGRRMMCDRLLENILTNNLASHERTLIKHFSRKMSELSTNYTIYLDK